MKKHAIIVLALSMLLPAFTSGASALTLNINAWLPSLQEESGLDNYQAYHTGKSRHYRSVSPFNTMNFSYDGIIRVSDNDRGIKSISPGGYLKISIRTFGNSRELLVTSDARGKLFYEFKEGRQEVPFEPEGRNWMEDVLLDVIRSTGIDAEGRTARIYGNEGLDAVLNELTHISSSSVLSSYFTALLEGPELSSKELSDVIYAISGRVSSNTECGRLFRMYKDIFLADMNVATAYFTALSKITSSTEKGRIYRNIDNPLDFSNPRLTEAYFTGADRISSDTEHGSVLRHTIENQELSIPATARLLISAKKISSNTESGRVIRSLGTLDFSHPMIWQSYFAAVDGLSISTESGSVLRDCLRKNKLDGTAMVTFLISTRKISSSTEISMVIRSIKDINLKDTGIQEAYFDVIRMTSSTSESGRMLRYTLENHKLNQASLINLYETTKRVSSSTEMSSILRASISYLPLDPPILDAFFACTNLVSSDTEKGRVLRQLAMKEGIDRYTVSGILHCAQRISSNTEAAASIRSVAGKVKKGDQSLRNLYMESAKTLSSDSEYRRTVVAIM